MSTATIPIYQPALDRGLSIIPLPPRDKACKLANWPDHATNDATIMNGHPADANYGVVANETFCILDIDDRDAFDAAVRVNLPLTYTVKTSRGRHLYFRHTEKSRKLGNKGAGIFDFQADRKYVVGERSTHPSGHVYECIVDLPIVEIPDALVDALDCYVGERKTARRNQGLKAGDRQDMLEYAGSIYTEEITEEEMFRLLQEKNEADSEVPLSDGDLARMVQHAFKKWEHVTEAPNVLIGKPALDAPAEECSGLDFVVAAKPSDDNYSDGWFPLGMVSIVHGSSGAGKSTWALQLLNTQAQGKPFFGHDTFGLPWIMVQEDRPAKSLMRTYKRMKIDASVLPLRPLPGSEHQDIASRMEAMYKVETVQPRIIFLEGLDLMLTKAKDGDSWVPVLKNLNALADRYNVAIICTVGAPKQKPKERYESPRDAAFGSQAVARMVETMVHVVEDYDTGDRRVTVMPRNARQERFGLVIRNGILVEAPVGTVAKLNERANAESVKFAAVWTPGMTWADCRGTFGDRISERSFYRWRDELKKTAN